jgi:hypothetical protein
VSAQSFNRVRAARIAAGIVLLAVVPAIEPISSEWARQAGQTNAEARRHREEADAGLFRCHVSEAGLPVFPYERMPKPFTAWEITIVPSFSDAVVLSLDDQRWSVSVHDHRGPDSQESALGRVTHHGSGRFAVENAEPFARLMDSALRTTSPETYRYQHLDGTMLLLRDRSGRCAQLHLHSSGTRGDRIVRLLDELAA